MPSSQHLPSYLGFSYCGRGVSLQGFSRKAHLLLPTLDTGYLLTAAPPDLELGVAPLSPPAPRSSRCLEVGKLLLAAPPPQRCRSLALSVATPDLGRGVAPHSLVSLIFLMRSLVFPILLFSSLSLQSSLRKLSYLSLLFFRTLDSEGYIFSFLLCLSLPFFSQLFVRPPQTTSLPFCISFSWGCF